MFQHFYSARIGHVSNALVLQVTIAFLVVYIASSYLLQDNIITQCFNLVISLRQSIGAFLIKLKTQPVLTLENLAVTTFFTTEKFLTALAIKLENSKSMQIIGVTIMNMGLSVLAYRAYLEIDKLCAPADAAFISPAETIVLEQHSLIRNTSIVLGIILMLYFNFIVGLVLKYMPPSLLIEWIFSKIKNFVKDGIQDGIAVNRYFTIVQPELIKRGHWRYSEYTKYTFKLVFGIIAIALINWIMGNIIMWSPPVLIIRCKWFPSDMSVCEAYWRNLATYGRHYWILKGVTTNITPAIALITIILYFAPFMKGYMMSQKDGEAFYNLGLWRMRDPTCVILRAQAATDRTLMDIATIKNLLYNQTPEWARAQIKITIEQLAQTNEHKAMMMQWLDDTLNEINNVALGSEERLAIINNRLKDSIIAISATNGSTTAALTDHVQQSQLMELDTTASSTNNTQL